MRICLAHPYFWPDTAPHASMLRTIAGRLASDGHEVTVLAAQPSYGSGADMPREPAVSELDGVVVRRTATLPNRGLRAVRYLNMPVFAVQVVAHLARGGYDVVVGGSLPPVLGPVAFRLGCWLGRSMFVHREMDIWPEVWGLVRPRPGAGYRVVRSVMAWVSRRTDLVLVLSEDMAETVRGRGVDGERIRVINNFEVEDFDGQARAAKGDGPSNGPVRVVFAGNLGRFQGLDTVVEASRRLGPEANLRVEFMGDGSEKAALRRAASELSGRVIVHDRRPIAAARAFIAGADLGLVTLRPGVTRVAYPSKTMTYLAEGLPLLVMAERDSSLARMVDEEGIGFVVEPGDVEAMAEVFSSCSRDPERLSAMRAAARRVYERDFERSRILDHWSELFREIEKQVERS